MFNNYEKMKNMEAVLTSALPEEVMAKGEEEGTGEELWVEEAQGAVYPTVAKETMSDTYPAGQAVSGESESGKYNEAGTSLAEEQGEPVQNEGDEASDADSIHTENTDAHTPDSSPTETDARQALAGGNTYQVQDGETLYGICLKLYGNGSMLKKICELNGLEDENKIISGQNLILP